MAVALGIESGATILPTGAVVFVPREAAEVIVLGTVVPHHHSSIHGESIAMRAEGE